MRIHECFQNKSVAITLLFGQVAKLIYECLCVCGQQACILLESLWRNVEVSASVKIHIKTKKHTLMFVGDTSL